MLFKLKRKNKLSYKKVSNHWLRKNLSKTLQPFSMILQDNKKLIMKTVTLRENSIKVASTQAHGTKNQKEFKN